MNAAVGEQIASGDHAGAVEQFFEEALGWTELAPEIRQMAIEAAPTYLDEMNDPDLIAFDLDWIRGFPHPVLLTQGDLSPPLFAPVIPRLAEALPSVEVSRFARAGHFIQAEQPEEYAEAVEGFIRENDRELARP